MKITNKNGYELDFTAALQDKSQSKVKTATLSIDYTGIVANPKLDTTQFAWAPPSDALDMKEAAGAENEDNSAPGTNQVVPK
jgi:hypothetical protein